MAIDGHKKLRREQVPILEELEGAFYVNVRHIARERALHMYM